MRQGGAKSHEMRVCSSIARFLAPKTSNHVADPEIMNSKKSLSFAGFLDIWLNNLIHFVAPWTTPPWVAASLPHPCTEIHRCRFVIYLFNDYFCTIFIGPIQNWI